MRTFAGKKDLNGLYAWLNPDLSINEKYSPTRLLSAYVEVDEEAYDEFLGCLPPIYHDHGFAISEETTGSIRLAFFRINGRLFAGHVEDGLFDMLADQIRKEQVGT